MPVLYLRKLTGSERSQKANRQLAHFLAFIAGAANAGGYVAVKQYTSHMSGIVSAMADATAARDVRWLAAGVSALLAFLAGAACTAILVNWGRRRDLHSEYALPMMLEAGLLLCFGLMGGHLARNGWFVVPATVALLCFTMGLQNAIITKISQAEIRTTHVTGMVTDIGIELGKALYWNRRGENEGLTAVRADLEKLWLLVSLVGLFFVGGVVGAVGFKRMGFAATLPLAVVLLMLAFVPIMDDVRERSARAS
ncbi:uncharacterized membrane protein YoaK (UPF0700 family) [Edaphobacter lichenicola]|uniref:Uncharacterized membrane protein YoaK (UPF0700 family) n=1 Tax=Tunturiibacter lichenicola TaxID=2051959 RepID=A0A7W8J7S6_9BACT|nr:uncharacterized membrane protein YoaK (UPF0700 family) [Edaphobacter lichenicola]